MAGRGASSAPEQMCARATNGAKGNFPQERGGDRRATVPSAPSDLGLIQQGEATGSLLDGFRAALLPTTVLESLLLDTTRL